MRHSLLHRVTTGAATPIFEEQQRFLLVTFRAQVIAGAVPPQVAPQVVAALSAACAEAKTREELQEAIGIKDREHFRKAYLDPMLVRGWLERTIPDRPRSRLQRYRTTEAGLAALSQASQ